MYPDGTVINYLFWMAIGALQVLIYKGVDEWAKDFNKSIKWWQTALLYGCVLSFFVVVFAGFTLKGECEGHAGWYMIGVFGSMHIIAGAVLVRLFLVKGRGMKLKASA
ncbi:MAG: hypothetical protein ABFD97_26380 [Syntrophobacter sp.]